MMDESGLELGLSLSSSRLLSQFNVKDAISDPKGVEGNATRPMGGTMSVSDDSFKNFFKPELENHDPKGKQKSGPIQYKQENFFTDLSKYSSLTEECFNDAWRKPHFTRCQELWLLSNRTIETEEEVSSSGKRKLLFEEINFQSKHQKLLDFTESRGNNFTEAPSWRNLHVSTGEHEEAAESEAGLRSWVFLSREEELAECSEPFYLNLKYALGESSGTDSWCQKPPFLSENEPKPNFENVRLGVPLVLHPLPVVSEAHSTAALESSTCVMQLMPIANGEPSVVPSVNSNILNYPSVRLPMLEEGSSWEFSSQSLHTSSFTSRKDSIGALNQDVFEDGVKTSEGSTTHTSTGSSSSHDGNSPDLKFAVTRESSDSVQGDGSKSRNPSRTTTNEGDGQSIKPGFAPSLELGGSSTGSAKGGQNGITSSWVACYEIDMSQEELGQHANGDGLTSSQIDPHLSTPTSHRT